MERLASRYLAEAPDAAFPACGFPPPPSAAGDDEMAGRLRAAGHGAPAARLEGAVLDVRALLARIDLLDGTVMDRVSMPGFDRDWADGLVYGEVDEEEADRVMGVLSPSPA